MFESIFSEIIFYNSKREIKNVEILIFYTGYWQGIRK